MSINQSHDFDSNILTNEELEKEFKQKITYWR